MIESKNIRVLSLHEPFATLFAYNIKEYETRPKFTRHRGIYLIHAAKTKASLRHITDDMRTSLCEIGIMNEKEFKFGCIIGAFKIDTCYCVQKIKRMYFNYVITSPYEDPFKTTRHTITDFEMTMGNYSKDRWLWSAKRKWIANNPQPWKGQQGYWQKFTGNIDELELIEVEL